ncbi:MAG: alkaline phosphatase [Flavobacteriales bacterium]|nr:alkaline phosphatase D family protein [Bacteroidales bacterium AH-315-I05]PCJ85171.1 MAG: alkaline phosphatase [Flavobacteriales bacterium]
MKKLFLLALLFAFHSAIAQRALSFDPALEPFYHGVASGDPTTGGFIIWTRVTPDSSVTGSVSIDWLVATDTNMTQSVAQGTVSTDPSKDYTVKVDVTGLQPNTYYYYEFNNNGKYSLRGRSKTLPIGDVDSLRFAIVSCANLEAGYFNSYASIKSRNDIDAVLHLGDYIYEYESGGYSPNPNIIGRNWDPDWEITELIDYRTRYSSYHLDEDLRKMHQQYPMIVIWDDHESANDSWFGGAENHTPGTEGYWFDRKSYANQAFNEWLPIREEDAPNDTTIFRKFSYGDLLDLHMLDTRLYGRDEQGGTSNTDTNRTILGIDQLNWLKNNLSSGTAQWNIIGQQVMMAPLTVFGSPVNDDQWDGYPAERDKLYKHVLNNSINDIVVLTGDIHTSWANNLEYNNQPAGVEFVATSVTSPGLSIPGGEPIVLASNPHIEFVNLTENGYVILDINKQRTVSEWYFVPDIDNQTDQATHETSWLTNYGDRFLSSGGAPVSPRPELNQPFAPENPRWPTGIVEVNAPGVVILGAYPNPFNEFILLHYYLDEKADIKAKLMDVSGRIIQETSIGSMQTGVNQSVIRVGDIAAGMYILSLESEGFTAKIKLLKK